MNAYGKQLAMDQYLKSRESLSHSYHTDETEDEDFEEEEIPDLAHHETSRFQQKTLTALSTASRKKEKKYEKER